MSVLKKIVTSNKIFFSILLSFYLVGALLIFLVPKEVMHIRINKFNSAWADVFFQYFTEVGSGVTVALVVVILFFFDKRLAFSVGLSALFAGLVIQGLKHLVFPDIMRPSAVIHNLHLVEGVVLNKMYSFPSGHTSTAFAMFSTLVFYFRRKRLKLLFLFLALLVGFSRIYLSQHFFVDVYFGSMIGLFFSILFYVILLKDKL